MLTNRAAVWVAVETSTGQVELELAPTVEIPTAWSEKAQWPRCLKRWPPPERVECIKVQVARRGLILPSAKGCADLITDPLRAHWGSRGFLRAAAPMCVPPSSGSITHKLTRRAGFSPGTLGLPR